MARIAIIALMLFAAAPALAQPGDTSAPAVPAPTAPPAQTDSSKSAPHPDPLSRSRIYPTSAADSDRTRVNPSSVAGGERGGPQAPAPPPPAAAQQPPPPPPRAPPPPPPPPRPGQGA